MNIYGITLYTILESCDVDGMQFKHTFYKSRAYKHVIFIFLDSFNDLMFDMIRKIKQLKNSKKKKITTQKIHHKAA